MLGSSEVGVWSPGSLRGNLHPTPGVRPSRDPSKDLGVRSTQSSPSTETSRPVEVDRDVEDSDPPDWTRSSSLHPGR